MNPSTAADRDLWPELPLESWQDTYHTLHMWSQIVGKVRLALSPKTNHWWEVPFYVNAVGLTTSPIPYNLRVAQEKILAANLPQRLATRLATGR